MHYDNILTMNMATVLFEPVSSPCIGRKQLNALNGALVDELGAALLAYDAGDGIGCIVVFGSEKSFAAGADIAAMANLDFAEVYKRDFITRNWETIRPVRKPVIAAVAGFALGDGQGPAMKRGSPDRTKRRLPFIKRPAVKGTYATQLGC